MQSKQGHTPLACMRCSRREDRDNPDSDSELAAYDLVQQKLLWRRKVRGEGVTDVYWVTYQLGHLPSYASCPFLFALFVCCLLCSR
jgi:hypothetical protein